MALICRNIVEWVEETIIEPIRARREEQQEQCKEEECNWWVLCANKIFCWFIVVIFYVTEWVTRIVGKWITSVVCEMAVFIANSFLLLVEMGAVMVDAIIGNGACQTGNKPHFDILKGIYLVKICNKAYEDPGETLFSEFDAINQDDIRFIQTDGAVIEDVLLNDTQVYLLPEGEQKRLIVAFRGSENPADNWMNIRDWLNDLVFVKTAFGSSAFLRVHSGIYAAYLTVREALKTQMLQMIEDYDIETVCFTGHSLGGGLATIAALDSCEWLDNNIRKECITFAAPCVGNVFFRNSFSRKVNESFRVVNAGDPVPAVPPQALGFKHVDFEFDLPEKGLDAKNRDVEEIMYVTCRASNEITAMVSSVRNGDEVGIGQHLLIDDKNQSGYIDRMTANAG